MIKQFTHIFSSYCIFHPEIWQCLLTTEAMHLESKLLQPRGWRCRNRHHWWKHRNFWGDRWSHWLHREGGSSLSPGSWEGHVARELQPLRPCPPDRGVLPCKNALLSTNSCDSLAIKCQYLRRIQTRVLYMVIYRGKVRCIHMRAIGCGTQLGDQMLVNISFFLFFCSWFGLPLTSSLKGMISMLLFDLAPLVHRCKW
jgi:hypothetical protein